MKIGFDNEKYLQLQAEHITARRAQFGGKLYLEFGGKLFDDYHASRVLPGFQPDSKIRMLQTLKDDVEIVVAICAGDIEKNKMRGDLGISYDVDVLRLIDVFRGLGFYVGSVVITQYAGQPAADAFIKRLSALGVKSYKHYPIAGYPSDVAHIVSDEGLGKNEYIETTRPLIVVTAPGPGSGKMATCLSQLYHDNRRGIRAGYAKYETFPIWNLPLKHPVNLAYEAATADLNDVNMIDPFHLEAYGKTTVNYNRDVEIFPVLAAMFRMIQGECPYKSPTDMGVNMAGNCIVDDAVCCEASRKEIVRRYYKCLCEQKITGTAKESERYKLELLMNQAGLTQGGKAVSMVLMLIGGSSGSTAGGLKTVTFLVVLLFIWARARGRSNVSAFCRSIPQEQALNAMTISLMMVLLSVLGGIFVCATSPVSFTDGLFEAISALATVGLTAGATGLLSVPAKILIIIFMYFGRVGVLTISLGFLMGNQAVERFRYAETSLLIG